MEDKLSSLVSTNLQLPAAIVGSVGRKTLCSHFANEICEFLHILLASQWKVRVYFICRSEGTNDSEKVRIRRRALSAEACATLTIHESYSCNCSRTEEVSFAYHNKLNSAFYTAKVLFKRWVDKKCLKFFAAQQWIFTFISHLLAYKSYYCFLA